MNNKPLNILWIQTDEQRTDSLRCYGNLDVKTPNIDELADRGMLFLNHHVQSPVCVPSRVCELTSLYPHQTGIFDNSVHYNWGKWPEGVTSFPELFAKEGYVTANFGKYHTPHHGTWLENWHFELFADEASHFDLAPLYDEKEQEVIHRGNNDEDVILSGKYPYTHGGRTPQSHITDRVIDWLRSYQHVRRPYLLRVSYLAPHTPVLTPEKYYNMYKPDDMNWDEPTEEILRTRPEYELDEELTQKYKAHNSDEFRRMRCSYYGLVGDIDEQVGRLIEELKVLDEYENTVVVYSSDHGTLMGEYGQFQKGMFYDMTTRVPFIIAGPNSPEGKHVNGLTESIDLGPTLLNMANIKVPDTMMGKNLLVDNNTREEVIGEIKNIRGGKCIRRSWIRTERFSMDHSSEIDGEKTVTPKSRDGKLIDLAKDPLGHHNLYYKSEYADILASLTKSLEDRLMQR